MPAGVTDQFAAGSWHVAHTRPFEPSDTKNGFFRSNGPLGVYVAVWPNALSKTRRLLVVDTASVTPPTSSADTPPHAAVISAHTIPVAPRKRPFVIFVTPRPR